MPAVEMIPLTQVCVSEVVWIVYLISTPQVDLELAKDKSPPPAVKFVVWRRLSSG